MSVLVCGGKLTYPIKISTDKIDVKGVSYVERLTDYLEYNQHIEKIFFIEAIDNVFDERDIEGFDGEITMITNQVEKYDGTTEEGSLLTEESLAKIVEVKKLEGLLLSSIQWQIMQS